MLKVQSAGAVGFEEAEGESQVDQKEQEEGSEAQGQPCPEGWGVVWGTRVCPAAGGQGGQGQCCAVVGVMRERRQAHSSQQLLSEGA